MDGCWSRLFHDQREYCAKRASACIDARLRELLSRLPLRRGRIALVIPGEGYT